MDKKKLPIGAVLSVLIWAVLTALLWFGPDKALSEAERRPLAQKPEISPEALLEGSFMEEFESWTLDQFPLRDRFRQIKALFHFYVLGQDDNNHIYLADGYAVKQEYPLDDDSVSHAADRFSYVYEKYLENSHVYFAVVPDKGQYLAEQTGHLTLDMETMADILEEKMPWAQRIDLADSLTGTDYYRTDIHWRQEHLLGAAQTIAESLDIPAPRESDYTAVALTRPFYGVYYGQAALPMAPETMYLLESELLQECRVYDYETDTWSRIYNMDKLESRDLYDVFLSGPKSLLRIENPHGDTDRELILFRDSFGSALAPLLVQGYRSITLVDLRYIQAEILDRFVTFSDQDVLFLYSVPVLNNSETIK